MLRLLILNVMVFMGLDNKYKAKTYILPLIQVKDIERIHIIKDEPFYNHNKTIFHSPPRILLRHPILKTIYKFILSIIILLRFNIDIVYGIQMFPHGIMTWISSKIFSKSYVLALINGDRELHSKNKILSKFASKVIREANFLIMEGITDKISDKSEIPKFLNDINISKEVILPGHSSCFINDFFPLKTRKKWDIITVSRLHKIKRIDLFIEIVEEVSKNRNIKCAIIGNGPMDLILKKMVDRKNLQGSIEFLGEIPNNKLNNYYNQSKLFLLSSKNEGLPATIIEAMLTEICVISTDVGSISRCIKHGFNGFIYNFENISDSTKIILNLLDNKDFREQIAKNGRITALSYSAGNRIKIWEEIINCYTKKIIL